MSRFIRRPLATNRSADYENLFKERNVKFIEQLRRKFPTVVVSPEAEYEYNKTYMTRSAALNKQEKIEAVKDKKDTALSIKGLKGELYDYQKVGVEFLLASGGRALIADPPGLGKTLQALAYLVHTKKNRSLIICPASVKSSWEKEVVKWTNLKHVVIDSKTKLHEIPADVKVWIVNYDILKKHLSRHQR